MGFDTIRRLLARREPDETPKPPGSTIPRDVISRGPGAARPADPGEAEANETRAAARLVPARTTTVLTLANGKRISARIINLSRTGVAVEPETLEIRPEDVILVGSQPVVPGRRLALGLVFTFRKALDEKGFGAGIVL